MSRWVDNEHGCLILSNALSISRLDIELLNNQNHTFSETLVEINARSIADNWLIAQGLSDKVSVWQRALPATENEDVMLHIP